MKEKNILNVYPLGGRTFTSANRSKTPNIYSASFWDRNDTEYKFTFYEYTTNGNEILKNEHGFHLLKTNTAKDFNETGFQYKTAPLSISGGLLQLDYDNIKDRIRIAQFICTPLCKGTNAYITEMEMFKMMDECNDFSEYQNWVNKHGIPVRAYSPQFHVIDTKETYKITQRHLNQYETVAKFGTQYSGYANVMKGLYYVLYNFVTTDYDLKIINNPLELHKQISRLVFKENHASAIYDILQMPMPEIAKKIKWHILTREVLKNRNGDFYYLSSTGKEEFVGTDKGSVLSALSSFKSLEKDLNEKIALYFGDFDEFCEDLKTLILGALHDSIETPKQTKQKSVKNTLQAEPLQL